MKILNLMIASVVAMGGNTTILWMRQQRKTEQAGPGLMFLQWMRDVRFLFFWLGSNVLLFILCLRLSMYGVQQDLFFICKRMVWMAVLLAAAAVDVREKRIPNRLLLAGIIYRLLILAGELIWAREGLLVIVLSELIGAGACFLVCMVFLLIFKNSIGMGDIKLLMVMGLYLGAASLGNAVMSSLLLIFCYAVFLLATKKKGRKDVLPFAPAICIGTYLSLFLTGM